jgi:hypothetical protein
MESEQIKEILDKHCRGRCDNGKGCPVYLRDIKSTATPCYCCDENRLVALECAEVKRMVRT